MARKDMMQKKLPTAVRKEQIVETALKILSDTNIKKLKMTDIAEHMNLAPSALYRHFRNKDAMLSAIFEYIRGNLHKNLETVSQKTDNALERLKELLFRHVRLIGFRQGIPRIIFSDELWGQKKERRLKMYRIVTGYLVEIEDIVREGQDKGQIRKDIDPGAVSRMFFGIVQPAVLLWHMSEGRYDLEGHIENAWPLFLKMLAKE